MDIDSQSLRHLHALRKFIGNLVEQAERSATCDCHKPPSLLLVGPPGAGKTYLVKQMSNVCEMPLFGVHSHQVRNPINVRKLFQQAREDYPSLVFLDDVDAIFSNQDEDPACDSLVFSLRDELFKQLGPRKLKLNDPDSLHNPTKKLLSTNSPGGKRCVGGPGGSVSTSRASSRASSMSRTPPRPSAPPHEDKTDSEEDDGCPYPDNNGIIVVAATSAPWMLYKDHEILSRFRGVYLVGLPDKQTRFNLLKSLLQDVQHNLTEREVMIAAENTEGFTPADLMVVVKTLSYRQFAFLLSMTEEHGGSEGTSSDLTSTGSQTPMSSELSEPTGSDSDLDGLPEAESALKRKRVPAKVKRVPSTTTTTTTTTAATGLVTTAAVAAAITAANAVNTVKPTQNTKDSDEMSSNTNADKLSSSSNAPHNEGNNSRSTAMPTPAVVAAAAAALTAATTLTVIDDDWSTDEETDSKSNTLTKATLAESNQPKTGPTRLTDEHINGKIVTELQLERAEDSVSPAESLDTVTQSPLTPTSPLGSTRGSEFNVPSPDSAIELSKSNEDFGVVPKIPLHHNAMLTPDSGSSTSGIVSSNCDSSDSSAIVDEEVISSTKLPTSDSNKSINFNDDSDDCENIAERTIDSAIVMDRDECDLKEISDAFSELFVKESSEDNIETVSVSESESDKRVGTPVEFELNYSEPPDPMKNDNDAVDSDSDNDVSESNRPRSRRVAFSGMSMAMEPLSIDVDDDEIPRNVSLDDLPPNITIANNALPQAMMRTDERLQEASSHAILRNLLSRPSGSSIVHNNLLDHHNVSTDDMHSHSDTHSDSEDPFRRHNDSRSSRGSQRNTNNFPDRGNIMNNTTNDCNSLNGLLSDCNNTSNDHNDMGGLLDNHNHNVNKTSTPIQPLDQLVPTPTLTPTPSEGSSRAGTIGSSGSGTRASVASTSSETRKKRDSDSSYDNSETPHVPSDVSTATCNETGDTLDCATDNEERLHGLESVNGRPTSGHNSDEEDNTTPHTGKGSAEDLHTLLNLDDLGEISIKIITLVDVLDVISKAYRSVTDEEIKRYTDFMGWFADVAKSACPHGSSDSHKANAPHLDDISLDSSACDTQGLLKKRKRRPLRKLGRFLLKALMLLLD